MRHSVAGPSDVLFRFGSFVVDPSIGRLHHEGVEVALTRKTFAVLAVLVTRHGTIVEKDELFRLVWPDTIVEENNLARCVSMLRKALRDCGSESEVVSTIAGRGYQFSAPVEILRRSDLDAERIVDAQFAETPAVHTIVNRAADGDAPPAASDCGDVRGMRVAGVRTAVALGAWAAAQLRRSAAVALLALTGVMAAAYILAASSPPAIEAFWKPILSGRGTPAVCVGPAYLAGVRHDDVVTVSAATTVSRIAGLLQDRSKPFEFKSVEAIDFAALRAQPLIAIGGYNNQWTLKLTDGLRFAFARDRTTRGRIIDREDPEAPGWTRVFSKASPPAVLEDFALVARVRDTASGQLVLAVGGIGSHGTAAAGELLTTPEHIEKFATIAPKGWERKNLQLVIATTVQDGVAGPPRIIATHLWD